LNTVVVNSNNLSYAADVIKRGGLVAVPTETVYGLACTGFDEDAVARVYLVKGRPEQRPLSLLVSGVEEARTVCADFPEDARLLAEAFWPGPLTLVLPKNDAVPDIVTAGGSTVGVRCPDHPATLELIRLVGTPLACLSANPSGKPAPISANDVLDYFYGMIDCIVDGGVCGIGAESTVVEVGCVVPYNIIRKGVVTEQEICRVICGMKARG
jgi:L-threonylcarbamoyladenylate synthase